MSQNKILITTPIFYPNDKPHIGSIHTMIIADFFTRSFRIFGYDVYFSTGLDEHGNKIYKSAKQKEEKVTDFLNNISVFFKNIAEKLKINYDRFIRTTDPDHKLAVIHLWNEIKQNGYIYEGEYKGYYDIKEERFYKKHELMENGNQLYAPNGHLVEFQSFKCFFLKSSHFLQAVTDYLDNHPQLTIPNNRINELKQFIQDGLNDLCISRDIEWGIPVPDSEDQVIYVWLDALTNYLTVCGYPDKQLTKLNWTNARKIHIIGKDIITFHGMHWLVILMAAKLPIFDNIVVHNWWLMDNNKMSKSVGNVVDPAILLEKYDYNVLRFYCIYKNLTKDDQDFSEQEMVNLFNSFAVNKLSNLIHRVRNILVKNNIDLNSLLMSDNITLYNNLKDATEQLDINVYLEILFKECDRLNSLIESDKAWNNLPSAIHIYSQILYMLQFFTPIFPDILQLTLSSDYRIIFQNIITVTPIL